jgi:Putative peptidoglycan binding domain
VDVDTNDLKRAREFAQKERGDKYKLGKQGPDQYDCTGIICAVYHVLVGNSNKTKRLFFTGNMATVLPTLGFQPGTGKHPQHDFVVGFSTKAELGMDFGHTAGSLGGLNVESRGGKGVLVGPTARSPGMKLFKHRMHLPISAASGVIRHQGKPFPGTLRRGDSGPNVKLVQRALKIGGAPLQGLGTFGHKTERHVKLFQLHRGLAATGVVNKATWDRLMAFLTPPTTMLITVGRRARLRTLARRFAKRFFKSDAPAAVKVMEKQLLRLNRKALGLAFGPGDTVAKGTRLKVPTTRP